MCTKNEQEYEGFENGEISEDDGIDEHHDDNLDPHFKVQPLPPEQRNYNHRVDGDGHVRVKNLSANWLPDITLEKEIGGTIYTISGSYEGTETLDRKWLRVLSHEMQKKWEAYIKQEAKTGDNHDI